jgi:hypothetical protein
MMILDLPSSTETCYCFGGQSSFWPECNCRKFTFLEKGQFENDPFDPFGCVWPYCEAESCYLKAVASSYLEDIKKIIGVLSLSITKSIPCNK